MKSVKPAEVLDTLDGTFEQRAKLVARYVQKNEYREGLLAGKLRVVSLNCLDCDAECGPKKIARMIDLWLHVFRCWICSEPVRTDVHVIHGQQQNQEIGCWALKITHKEGGEVSDRHNGVCLVHDLCWSNVGKKRTNW